MKLNTYAIMNINYVGLNIKNSILIAPFRNIFYMDTDIVQGT